MPNYTVNASAVARARRLTEARQYVLTSNWGDVQPQAADEFVVGDFRRVHRMGLIACQYRAAEWRHKQIELAAHELLQLLDEGAG